MANSNNSSTIKGTNTMVLRLRLILSVFLFIIVSAFASCDKETPNETEEKILTHEDSLALGLIHENPTDTTSTQPDNPPTPPAREIQVIIDNIIYVLNEDELTAKVCGIEGDDPKIMVIPESVSYNNSEYPVVTIGGFYYHTKIEKVVIKGEKLKIIEPMAFAKCFRLSEINLPNSLIEIGAYAFHNCSLSSVSFPNSLSKIGKAAFRVCPIETVVFPNNLETIGDEAFYNCSLGDITIPNVKNIGAYAFQYCNGIKSVKIIAGLETIGEKAFDNCRYLKEIWIPKSLQTIGNNAFGYCSNVNKVMIEDPVSWCHVSFATVDSNPLNSGSRLFNFENEEITEVTISKGITAIGNYLFIECPSIVKVTIPDGVSTIGEGVFWGCNNIETLYISKDVNNIGQHAFDCKKIQDIYCYATQVPKTGYFSFYPRNATTLHVPYQSLSLYKSTDPWKYFGSIVSL